jgi:hypothetical protein
MYRNGAISLNAEFRMRIIGCHVIKAGTDDGVMTIRGGTNVLGMVFPMGDRTESAVIASHRTNAANLL